MAPGAWEDSTGLLSSLIPQAAGAAKLTDPNAYNLMKGEVKLGPAPMNEELRTEAERMLREHAMLERDPTAGQYDTQLTRPQPLPGMTAPTEFELLPQPPAFKTIDVDREVSAVKDIRKRIRLEPSLLSNVDLNSPQANTLRARALPSICAYTMHNVQEGCVGRAFMEPSFDEQLLERLV